MEKKMYYVFDETFEICNPKDRSFSEEDILAAYTPDAIPMVFDKFEDALRAYNAIVPRTRSMHHIWSFLECRVASFEAVICEYDEEDDDPVYFFDRDDPDFDRWPEVPGCGFKAEPYISERDRELAEED